jgi:hypothetical protein
MVKLASSVVAAVVRLTRMFSPLVMAPLFQLLALLQSALEPLPVQVSVVCLEVAFGLDARGAGWLAT